MTRSMISLLLWMLSLIAAGSSTAEDWPEWRGAGRLGIWTEDGIVEKFPEQGLRYTWRVPIHGGYAGPAVADGRVFVTDFRLTGRIRGIERALALDEATGEVLWTHEWEANYAGLEPRYAIGPRATPTVDGDRVYVVGAMGALFCFDAETGRVLWQKDFVADFGTKVPVWGMAGAPLVEGDLLIALVGGQKNSLLVAFHKMTGKEVWRSLETGKEPGYGPPVGFDLGGQRQVVLWHPQALSSVDPSSGKLLWEVPFEARLGLTVATPVLSEDKLLVSAFFDGSLLLEVGEEPPVKELWRGKSSSEIDTDGLHSLMTTPMVDGNVIYGICSHGQLRALDLRTGERIWESMDAVVERARWAAAFLVRHGDRYLINNDRGELILARLSRDGYEEIDRTPLIEPTSPIGRREKRAVHWSHPAYANGHIVTRNDREIVRARLIQDAVGDPVP